MSALSPRSGKGLQVSSVYATYAHIKVFKHQVLFRVDFLSVTLDHRVQCPRVGLGVKI